MMACGSNDMDLNIDCLKRTCREVERRYISETIYFELLEPVHILILRCERKRKLKRRIIDFWLN